MAISFFFEEIEPKSIGFDKSISSTMQSWVETVIKKEGYTLENINYIFCSDAYLLKMNQDYLDHDTYTDIITFDNSDKEKTIDSDIFISIDRVKENSTTQGTEFKDELSRVLIHGVLHLMGWSDKTNELKKEMRKKEDACLSLR